MIVINAWALPDIGGTSFTYVRTKVHDFQHSGKHDKILNSPSVIIEVQNNVLIVPKLMSV